MPYFHIFSSNKEAKSCQCFPKWAESGQNQAKFYKTVRILHQLKTGKSIVVDFPVSITLFPVFLVYLQVAFLCL